MFYDKKIKYLDYRENGERVRGGGHIKLEVRDKSLRMDVSVAGLYPTDVFERDVILCGKDREGVIGKIKIASGRGTFQYLCRDIQDMAGKGFPYEELRGIRIPVGADREISCMWREGENTGVRNLQGELTAARRKDEADAKPVRAAETGKDERRGDIISSGDEKRKILKRESFRNDIDAKAEIHRNVGEGSGEKPGSSGEKDAAAPRSHADPRNGGEGSGEKPGSSREKDAAAPRSHADPRNGGEGSGEKPGSSGEKDAAALRSHADPRNGGERGSRNPGSSAGRGRPAEEKTVRLLEDKWQQLYAMYPHIHPFGDEREYISIGPADFVLFPSESYRMANNSFLLHGYYNYRHLILAKVEKRGEIYYYIGVPGNFYEKEKQVAIMFGFESFECAEEPAQPGDFGYYMMRTQL